MRNAWHFYHALILVIKVVCGNIVLRCSPLKRALVAKEENAAKTKIFRAKVRVFLARFSHFNF
ncbi:TPA: DUF3265 domain-containing protein [Vibrio parahaemolyticus]|nr:DUF3265 domain-containing protein [Vibrio parahaemolyticus]